MNFKIKLAALLCAALITLCACACGNDNEVTPPEDDTIVSTETEAAEGETDTEPETDASTEEEPIEEEQPEEPQEILFYNPLTGMECDEYTAGKRPVAMMINNIKKSIPQPGIGQADIIYECIVEGGITRLMALFSKYEDLPETGSVRSSRDYYLDLAQAHDAIYSHCGGSDMAYSTISARGIDNIDGVNGSSAEAAAYWKNQQRVKSMGYEHASMTNGEKITKAISDMGFRTTLSENFDKPLNFSQTPVEMIGNDALSLNIKYSYYASSFFSYDESTGLYKKGQYNAPHIDGATNEILTFKNVIVLFATYKNTGDKYNHMILNFTGNGKGLYITDGKVKEIVWTKSDRQTPYKLFEADGSTPLLLNAGKSYIGITNLPTDVTVSDKYDFIVE